VRAYFNSDNYAPVLPEVMDALAAVNHGHEPAYGADAVTARVQALLKAEFGEQSHAFLVLNGTGANVVGLRSMLRPWQGVICAESAHLNVDEGGAPEVMGGIKLLTVPTPDGKLTPELVDSRLQRVGDEHVV
jgi:threonine aldolase